MSLVGVAGVVFPLATAAPATAASALQCVTPYIYATTDTGVYQINTQTGVSTGPLSTSVGNQLGITPGGGTAIWTSGGRIIKYDAATATTTSIAQRTLAGVGAVAGGVNPTNGLFYYGGFGPSMGQFTVFVYNPVTNSTTGPVATINLPAGATNGNGDIAFDSLGRAYVLVSGPPSTLVRIDQPLPTTLPLQTLTSTTVVSISGADTGPFGGYAFGADGYLYASHGTSLYRIDPNTGVDTAAPAITGPAAGAGISDLGTCAVPNTIQVRKNLPAGRATATDQFGLSVTGNGLSVGNTGTTTGSQTGIQNQDPSEIAGPVLGIAGRTYNIAETPTAGTDLTKYSTSWSCVNLSAGSAVVASGTGATGSFVLPSGGADIVCTFTNTPLVPKIAVSKASTTTSITAVGQQVPFTFLVSNTGNVPLTNVSVTDVESPPATQGNLSPVTCPSTTLAPGATETCSATYTVTQADLDNGQITDTATASGTAPSGQTVTSPPSVLTVPGASSSTLSLVKGVSKVTDVNGNGITDAGDQIFYNFTVTNTGNVTMSGIAVNDPLLIANGIAVSCPSSTLAPGAVETCTSATGYVITQADVDAGSVSNTATAQGTPPGSTTPVVSPPSSTSTPTANQPAISLAKTASTTTLVAGQTITYTMIATNTGDVTLSGVTIAEGAFTGSGSLSSLTCNPAQPATLAPGAKLTCTATYVVTQADVDAGSVTNHASVSGNPPTGPPVTATDQATVTGSSQGSLSVVKSVSTITDVNGNGITDAGDQIFYNFNVTNTGNVTMSGIAVNDPLLIANGIAVSCPSSTLAPGAVETCTSATGYVITQADVDAGSVSNTATAQGTPPGSTTPVVSPPSSTSTPTASQPAITLVKTADKPTLVAGQTITYTMIATNTGDVTLSDASIAEGAFTGSGSLSSLTCSPAQPATLAPGAKLTCTATYVVTQADVNSGSITNTATASGTPPSGAPVTSTATVTVSAPNTIACSSLYSLGWTANPHTIWQVDPSTGAETPVVNVNSVSFLNGLAVDPATNTFWFTNQVPGASTVTIYSVNASTGTQATFSAPISTTTGPLGGAFDPANGLYYYGGINANTNTFNLYAFNTHTQTAVGQVAGVFFGYSSTGTNNVSDIAFDSQGRMYFTTDSTAGTQPSRLYVTQVPVPSTAGTGNLLANLISTSPSNQAASGGLAFGSDGSLYLEQTSAGTVEQIDPTTGVVVATRSLSPYAQQQADLASCASPNTVQVQKNLPNGRVAAGDQFNLTITGNGVQSTGNHGTTTGTSTGVQNQSPSEIAGPIAGLAGLVYNVSETAASTTALSNYVSTWSCVNTATGTSVASGGGTSGSFTMPNTGAAGASIMCTFTNVPATPAIKLVKTANVSTPSVGQTVTYTFVATNTGDVTVHGLQIHDPVLAAQHVAVVCNPSTLKPGQSVLCVQVQPYFVTAADQARGYVKNVAIGSAYGPGGSVIGTNQSTVVTPVGGPPGTSLPNTGGPTMTAWLAAFVSLSGGLVLMCVGRRRRTE